MIDETQMHCRSRLLNSSCGAVPAIILALFILCIHSAASDASAEDGSKAFDPANMNLSIRPGDDFYGYVNGGWIKSHPVPADKPSYDDFWAIEDLINERLRAMIEEAANNTTLEEGSNQKKIADLYRMGMDTASIEAQDISPLDEELRLISNISRPSDVQSVMTHMMKLGMSPVFNIYSDSDRKNGKMMMAVISQGGLGLPDRDYYFRQDNDSIKTREEYLGHVSRMFVLLGDSPGGAEKSARTVMRMETRLANASFSSVEDRDDIKTYNKMSIGQLQELSPGIDWTRLTSDLGRPDIKEANVMEPSFFKELGAMMLDENASNWETFLKWKLISGTAPYLSSRFENESFDFYERKMSGQEEMEPRWKRVMDGVNSVLGEAMGREYVARYFDPQSKARMVDLVENLRRAFRYRIQNLTWMENSTKAKALDKLDSLQINVGYPNKWRDYSGLEIKDDSYVRNIMRGWSFEFRHGNYGIDKIGKPVDRDAWGFWPHEVNAGANLQKNTVTFPAGILQPPFFSRDADDAINYGAIGAIIGHEITHGFDDQGRRYDKNGNLTDWWSKDDGERFNESTHALVDEYDGFEVLPGLYINGNLTLGENIADLGGAAMAYHAYKLSQKSEPEKIDGFTGDQRFFLGFAQMWRQSIKEEMLRMDALTDVHSTARFRVDGVVYDIPEFYDAFKEVRPGDKMYRSEKERSAIW